MGTVRRRIELPSGAQAAWTFATDPGHFSDYVAGWVRSADGPVRATGPGAQFRWTGALGPLRLETTERVVEWEPGRRVRYEGETTGVRFRSSMEFEPLGPDRTALTVEIQTAAPRRRGGALTEAVVDRIVAAGVRTSLERLRRALSGAEAPEREQIVDLYRRRAARYDLSTRLYGLAGARVGRYRTLAIEALALRPGATVIEIGCGTGANFARIQERIGPSGRLIGVDLTDAMLERAARRVAAAGWRNVELVHSDASDFAFPEGTDGILSTLALTLCPTYDDVIARGARALAPGGRWVVLDLQLPQWPRPLIELALALTRPFGVSLELASRRPADSIRRHLPPGHVRSLYFGALYLAVGIRSNEPHPG